MKLNKSLELKPLFVERMKLLLEKDYKNYLETIKTEPPKSIRCNTIKISPDKLKKRLQNKGWKIKQPFKDYLEIFIIESKLEPGELGRSLEHQLGYYYVQEIASMLPILALDPKPNDLVLDLCSAPGSKTTQAAAKMKNTGTIIANEVSFGRLRVLATNLQRCGVTNTIITKKDGVALCKKLAKENIHFDKILIDAPCSGEGTIRSSPKTCKMWNIKSVKNLSRLQKALVSSAVEILKPNGELVYSTCTHAPEENEEVVDFIIQKFPNIKIQKINLPIRCREGITSWNVDNVKNSEDDQVNKTSKFELSTHSGRGGRGMVGGISSLREKDKTFNKELNKSCRIYPQDANTEGFFIAKFKKIK